MMSPAVDVALGKTSVIREATRSFWFKIQVENEYNINPRICDQNCQ